MLIYGILCILSLLAVGLAIWGIISVLSWWGPAAVGRMRKWWRDRRAREVVAAGEENKLTGLQGGEMGKGGKGEGEREGNEKGDEEGRTRGLAETDGRKMLVS